MTKTKPESDLEKILLKGIKLGVFFALFTPLILAPLLFATEYPKAVFFRVLVEFVFILYLILLYKEGPKYLPKIKGRLIFISIVIFIATLIASTFVSVTPHESFWGGLTRSQGLIFYLHLFAYFWVLVSVFKARGDWIFFLKWTVFISGIASFAGVLQALGVASFYGTELPQRISGTLANPDFFGSYIVLSIFLGVFLLTLRQIKKSVNLSIILSLITVLNFIALILSGHRGAWVGLGAGFAFFAIVWFFLYSGKTPRLRRAVFWGIVVSVILATLIILNWDKISSIEGFYLIERIVSVFDIDGVLSNRLPAWEVAVRGWKERPILGWGLESFSFVFDKYLKAGYFEYIREGFYFDRVHNAVLEFATNAGTLGVLGYLFTFFSPFYVIRKYRKVWGFIPSLALASFFFAYFFLNLSIFDTVSSYALVFLVLAFINNNFKKEEEEGHKKEPSGSFFKSVYGAAVALLVLIFILCFYALNLIPLGINIKLAQAKRLESSDLLKSLEYHEQVNEQKSVFSADFKWASAERLRSILQSGGGVDFEEELMGAILIVTSFFEKELEDPSPRYLRLHELLARLYEAAYVISSNEEFLEKMEQVAKNMINFNEDYPASYRILGEVEILRGEYEEGETLFQKALDINRFRFMHKLNYYKELGAVYLRVGERAKAAENFKEIIDLLISASKSLRQANRRNLALELIPYIRCAADIYWKELNDPQTAVEIYEKALLLYPGQKEVLQQNIEILKQDL